MSSTAIFLALALAPPAPQAAIEGRVLHLLTGQPVPRAAIVVHDSSGRLLPGALTGADGRFSLTALSAGRYRLRAERSGFLSAEYPALLSTAAGQRLADIDIRLTPHSVLSGRVTGPDGEPLQDAAVYCFLRAYSHGRKSLTPAATSTTDDRGEFRLPSLAPGAYLVAAVFSPSASPGSAGRESYAPAFYPNAADPSGAAPVVILPGQDAPGIDLTIRPAPAVLVRGQLSPPSAAGGDVAVRLLPREPEAAFFLVRNGFVRPAGGHFEIPGVLPGSYVLSAESFSAADHSFASLPLDVPPTGIDGLDLPLAPAPSVSGVVISDTSSPPLFDRITLSLQPLSPPPARPASVRLAANGAFSFPDLPPGTYALSLRGLPEQAYLASIRAGDLEIPEDALTLQPGSSTRLRILLGHDSARIDGAVAGPQGDRHWATVLLVPERRHLLSRYRRSTTDQHGAFSLTGLAPGAYELYAWDELEPGAEFDPALLAAHLRSARRITLAPGAAETVALPLLRAGGTP